LLRKNYELFARQKPGLGSSIGQRRSSSGEEFAEIPPFTPKQTGPLGGVKSSTPSRNVTPVDSDKGTTLAPKFAVNNNAAATSSVIGTRTQGTEASSSSSSSGAAAAAAAKAATDPPPTASAQQQPAEPAPAADPAGPVAQGESKTPGIAQDEEIPAFGSARSYTPSSTVPTSRLFGTADSSKGTTSDGGKAARVKTSTSDDYVEGFDTTVGTQATVGGKTTTTTTRGGGVLAGTASRTGPPGATASPSNANGAGGDPSSPSKFGVPPIKSMPVPREGDAPVPQGVSSSGFYYFSSERFTESFGFFFLMISQRRRRLRTNIRRHLEILT